MIRKMLQTDKEQVFQMMRVFYDSPAVKTKSSDEVLLRDIDAAVGDCPFLDGFVIEEGGEIIGYGMVSRGYSTEYGGECVLVEDLYLKPHARRKGHSSEFFRAIEENYPQAVRFRLEVEEENFSAVAAYEKMGYRVSDYLNMSKER